MLTKGMDTSTSLYWNYFYFSDIPASVNAYNQCLVMNGKDVSKMKMTSNTGYTATLSCLDNGNWTYIQLRYNVLTDVSGHEYVILTAYASGITVEITRA